MSAYAHRFPLSRIQNCSEVLLGVSGGYSRHAIILIQMYILYKIDKMYILRDHTSLTNPPRHRIISVSNAASSDVNTPAAAIAHDETDACRSEWRTRLAVPIPCEAVPIAAPIAWSFLTPNSLSNGRPRLAPSTPARITSAIVICGIPCSSFETSIAIGVVTDFGTVDITTAKGAPKAHAVNPAVAMPTTVPANTTTVSRGNEALSSFPCLSIGIAKATVAGPSHQVR